MTTRVFVIIAAHNRREITLACLRRLRAQGVLTWSTALVVDDGSSDGTGDAVRLNFPEVAVLRGNGNLYWTGATAWGMRRAVELGAEYVFWLNDDCEPQPGALAALLAVAQTRHGVAGGIGVLPRSGQPIYGGFHKMRNDLEHVSTGPGDVLACDALNGNLVCVPRTVIDAVGFPDGRALPHAMGDVDYTLRAQAAGFPVLLVGAARADAVPNNRRGYASWLLSGMTVYEVWATMGDRRAYGFFPAELRFRVRHWGVRGFFRALWSVAKRIPVSAAIWLVPLATRRRWWSTRSAAWRTEQMVRAEADHE